MRILHIRKDRNDAAGLIRTVQLCEAGIVCGTAIRRNFENTRCKDWNDACVRSEPMTFARAQQQQQAKARSECASAGSAACGRKVTYPKSSATSHCCLSLIPHVLTSSILSSTSFCVHPDTGEGVTTSVPLTSTTDSLDTSSAYWTMGLPTFPPTKTVACTV